ncbi:MAG: deoxynucleoside kinase [Deltaproteobacteria bacterium]|nr:deoxynucleoside kinase [Deltaproteobacteria bacterium]
MERFRYIVIEGPIGVGKTSLARLLANEFGARLILESPDDNPFLPAFYRDRRKYAFQTQIYFLLSRYKQQSELHQQDLFNQVTICDYLFARDRIFAYVNLDEHETALYEQIFRLLNAQVVKPDLVVYLQADPAVLLGRIRDRDKEYERAVTSDYLEELTRAYNEFFFHYNETPLLVVNTSAIDFVKNAADLGNLVKEIRGMKKGTQYYVPLGSR